MNESMVTRRLEHAREAILPDLARYVATLDPEPRRVVQYHLGFVEASGAQGPGPRGKALRPALALLSAEAVGGDPDDARAGALAVELLHDYTLLHDDVMDRDRLRRGRETAWSVFGEGAAICAGDALAALAQRVLLDEQRAAAVRALVLLGEANERLIAGQMLDASFEGRVDVTPGAYLRMAGQKTGALLGCAAAIGATLVEAPEASVRTLQRFGEHLGLAFQAVDDWLGLWADPGKLGKPIGSDLRQRKASYPIVHAAASGTSAGALIRDWLQTQDEPKDLDVERALAWVGETGAEEATLALARRERDRALEALREAWLAPHAREALAELAGFVVERVS